MDTIANALIPIDIEDEMRNSYLDYSMSVIIGRALPDVRDGLKPVHRRILYAMFREGNLSNRRYSKCAGVVGEVLKSTTPMVIQRCMTPWFEWRSRGTCGCPWWMAKETLVLLMAILLLHTGTPNVG